MNAMPMSWVISLGWALVDFLWQGALVGMATAIALALLRNARPQTRYAVACTALALCMALPVGGFLRGLNFDSVATAPQVATAASWVAAPLAMDNSSTMAWRPQLQDRLPWLVVLWSIGAALLAVRMALGMRWVARLGRVAADAGLGHWQARLDELATRLGIGRAVRLRAADDLASPVTAGCWRPIVLVPALLLTKLPPDLLEALLAHELAHIKRHDYLINLTQSTIEALLFYHPVVWWLSHRIRIEREQIADDLAARVISEPRRLALALHALDQFQLAADSSPVSLAPAATGGNLMTRIQRLIRPSQHALSWKMSLPILGMTAFCLTVYAHGTTPLASASQAASASVAAIVPAAKNKHETHGTLHVSGRQRDAYAVVRSGQDGITMSGDTRDVPVIEKTREKIKGDFVWARRGEKTYVVQDPDLIARIVDSQRPMAALDAQMDALDAQMDVPNRQLEALSQQMESLEGKGRPFSDEMEKTSARMEVLGRQQEALGAKMETLGRQVEQGRLSATEAAATDQQMQALQAQMEPLSREMDTLGAQMEQQSKQMEAAHAPMEALSRQMQEVSKPMEALGKQMDVLGKQIEQTSHEVDRTVNRLIDDAMRSGKATPLGESAQ